MDQLQNQHHRQSTRENYYAVWKSFNRFFLRLDCKPTSWEKRLTLFVGHLINCNRKSSTIRSYISAIKAVLTNGRIKFKLDESLLAALTQACKLKNDRVQTRLPITKDIMHSLLDKVEESFKTPQPYLTSLYRAMISVAYYGLFRIGEITSSPHVVKAADVKIGTNKDKLMFTLHTSKTHGLGNKPQIVKISSSVEKKKHKNKNFRKVDAVEKYCPFRILSDYLRRRKPYINESEQFFIFKDRTPVRPEAFRKLLTKLFKKLKRNPKLYCSHAFRAGRAVDMLKMGISVETIRKIGRWKSSAVYTYLHT